jgi:hypothetical protein
MFHNIRNLLVRAAFVGNHRSLYLLSYLALSSREHETALVWQLVLHSDPDVALHLKQTCSPIFQRLLWLTNDAQKDAARDRCDLWCASLSSLRRLSLLLMLRIVAGLTGNDDVAKAAHPSQPAGAVTLCADSQLRTVRAARRWRPSACRGVD